jgi:hypothetical protein
MARTTCKTVSHARRRNTTTLRVNHSPVASRRIRPPERCLTAREMIDAWRTGLGTALSPPGRRSTKGLSIAKLQQRVLTAPVCSTFDTYTFVRICLLDEINCGQWWSGVSL